VPDTLHNPYRGVGLPGATPLPASDPQPVAALLAHCPAHSTTPLVDATALARRAGVASLHLKDERGRMGLGSFKALGAAYAIAHEAAQAVTGGDWAQALRGRTYVTASAGNHGLSLAAGARLFGAQAIVYLAETVPQAFAARLRCKGAEVIRAGVTYEDSMAAAEAGAHVNGWTLLSDSSWPGYTGLPWRVMEGYLQLAAEAESALLVAWKDVARSAPPDVRERAWKLALEEVEARETAEIIDRYRDIVNFDFWRATCEAEVTEPALRARELTWQADREFAAARLQAAKAAYEKAFEAWREVFDASPILREDDLTADDIAEIVGRYRNLLEQLDEPFPSPFILDEILARAGPGTE